MASKPSACSTTLITPEILTRILEFAIAKGDLYRDFTEADSGSALFGTEQVSSILDDFSEDTLESFMTVCKTWHEVIMTTPALWATFSVILRMPEQSYAAHVSSMLDIHFQRSKAAPFTLFIYGNILETLGKENEHLAITTNMLKRVFTHQAHRLQAVYVTMTLMQQWDFPDLTNFTLPQMVPIMAPTMLSVSLEDMPVLKSLLIYSYLPVSCPEHRVQLAPHECLESMHIVGDVDIIAPTTPHLTSSTHFTGLRNLYLKMPKTKSGLDAWNILLASPNIESLHLECQSKGSFGPQVQSSDLAFFTFPHLRSLDISSGFTISSLDVLSRFTLPSLTSLKVGDFRFDSSQSLVELAALLAQYRLESFKIGIWSIEDTSYEEVFRALFNALVAIKRLEITFQAKLMADNHEPLFEALRNALVPGRPNDASALSNLRELSVIIEFSKTDDVHGILRNMVSIVPICKRKYPSKFSIDFLVSLYDSDKYEEAEHIVLDDENIRRCISDTFSVSVNDEYVEEYQDA
ncbi:hypothetical protein SCHPADRAFT_208921 [Schizopora paradoxa]|uniref:Uncharacterized protein n=1 Tax=Schizopora paradoxa TaxID=27342 RepID=A0A0H2SHE9_9AGAM|nr:hypothetical protein SCHPADRAFT_208921 [Schizopora paradoxa]